MTDVNNASCGIDTELLDRYRKYPLYILVDHAKTRHVTTDSRELITVLCEHIEMLGELVNAQRSM